MRKIGKYSRSGLASIVTTAIMLTAIAIMGSGVVVWGKSTFSTNEMVLASSSETSINRINENLAIEKIWFGTNPQKFLNITMTNNGNIGLNVTQIQFSTSTTSKQFQFTNQAFLPKKTGSIQIPFSYSNNIPINILITTARGSILTTQASP
jgi:archaellum component FlaF (FlaF/FlaG flagellin family)